jgi:myosin heavy chain 6/7
MKKKLEGDVVDLDCSLEHANAANAETQRTIKSYQLSLREAQAKLESEQIAKESAHDALINADRKANSNQNALEEARTLLEQADRARRKAEQELADTNETLSDQSCTNQSLQGAKMKTDAEMATLQGDLDEMMREAQMSEEKAQRAMIDAAQLADELRREQELAQMLERGRKMMECQVKDMQGRVDEAQANALKGGKKAMNKMDTRIRELESELDAENRRMGDTQKNMRKSERKIKELAYQQDEDRNNHERMQALIDQMQGKIKSYKKQIEEAEEIAAQNLAKYRMVQSSVAEATERADGSEESLARMRTRARSASIGPVSIYPHAITFIPSDHKTVAFI